MIAFLVDVESERERLAIVARLGKYGEVRVVSRKVEAWAAIHGPDPLVGMVSDRDRGTYEQDRVPVLYVKPGITTTREELNDWTIYAIALSLTSNPMVADAVRTLAERWGLSVRKAELLAALVTTGSIRNLSELLGVSDNTTKTLAQRLLMSARESEEGKVMGSMSDLVRAVLGEVAGDIHVGMSPALRGGERRA